MNAQRYSVLGRPSQERHLGQHGWIRRSAFLIAAGFFAGFVCLAGAASENVLLNGVWRFQLDRQDVGLQERWFESALPDKISLPGALQNQGFGDDITVDTKWTGETGADRWRQRPEYEKYRQPGNIKIPFFLQPEKHYVGAAWYQRDIEIPRNWEGKRVVLSLERPHWETRLWLDGQLIGTNESLSVPHVYDLGHDLKPGKHTLTLRIDNRLIVDVGAWAHCVTDHTQGNWNGVVGKLELSAEPLVWIEDLQVFPNVENKSVTVKGKLANVTKETGKGTIHLTVRRNSVEPSNRNSKYDPGSTESRPTKVEVSWTAEGATFATTVPIPDARLWDEFSPALYTLIASLNRQDAKAVTFGLREIVQKDRQFLLNGHPAFFRGTLECCIFPKTGYPPTDVESWKRVVRICKSYGLNHIRFHSWCPPEAAFVAADELGFYYSVECAVWHNPGDNPALGQWLYRESDRIVRAYGNHPSFVLMTHGNEPSGPNRDKFLAGWVNFWKERDSRRLYTSGSAFPQLPENQYHVHYTCRGLHGWLGKDYRKDIEQYNVPIIVHEMGQWCVYPNFDEMKKYTGPLKPKNFEIFRDSLAEHGMLDQWKHFLHASGKFQVLCYKEEIEAAMRTPGIGGIQLLDLHDFPGQGTALVGVLDPFWDSKGYVTPEEYRRFFSPTVPLTRLLKRIWMKDETLTADVEVAHYGNQPIETASSSWRIVDGGGNTVLNGRLPNREIPVGQNIALGQISADLSQLPAPKAYKLVVRIEQVSNRSGTGRIRPAENDWNIWVYPKPAEAPVASGVLVTSNFDNETRAVLAKGGKVLLTPRLSSVHPKLTFEPIFWNHYMFTRHARYTLGLLCHPKHPALASFPTDLFCDWQWNDIVTNAHGLILDNLPQELRPIVQPIDDWNTNRRLGLLFECRVGTGKLLICSADLDSNLSERPGARQLRKSLLDYVSSEAFNPKISVTVEQLETTLHRRKASNLDKLGAKVIQVDSAESEEFAAANAIDGDPETIWHTAWSPSPAAMPHHMVIDLGKEVMVKGFSCLPRNDNANGRIKDAEIYFSNDAAAWGEPIKQSWPNNAEWQTCSLKEPVKARYVKLVAKSEVNGNDFASVAEFDIIPAK